MKEMFTISTVECFSTRVSERTYCKIWLVLGDSGRVEGSRALLWMAAVRKWG